MKNKDLVSNYVYQTTNYDQFKLSDKNRKRPAYCKTIQRIQRGWCHQPNFCQRGHDCY